MELALPSHDKDTQRLIVVLSNASLETYKAVSSGRSGTKDEVESYLVGNIRSGFTDIAVHFAHDTDVLIAVQQRDDKDTQRLIVVLSNASLETYKAVSSGRSGTKDEKETAL
jgi:phosphorylcholine metabolism protein LicD